MSTTHAVLAAAGMPGSHMASKSFDPTIVGLSFIISFFGSLCGLQSARKARNQEGPAKFAWLASAAVWLDRASTGSSRRPSR